MGFFSINIPCVKNSIVECCCRRSISFLGAALAIFVQANGAVADSGLSPFSQTDAAWQRFAFAPKGFGRFLRMRTMRDRSIVAARRVAAVKSISGSLAARAYKIPVAIKSTVALQRNRQSGSQGESSKARRAPVLEPGRSNGRGKAEQTKHRAPIRRGARAVPRDVSVARPLRSEARRRQIAKPTKGTANLRRQQRFVAPRGAAVDRRSRRSRRVRVPTAARGRIGAVRPPPVKVYSLVMETPAWARRAFKADR